MDRWHQSGAPLGWGPAQVRPTSSIAGRRQRCCALGDSLGGWSPSLRWSEKAPCPRCPDRLGLTEGEEVGQALRQIRAVQGPPGLPAGPPVWRELRWLWRSESEQQSPRPREPRPKWGELPKPRLQAPQSLSPTPKTRLQDPPPNPKPISQRHREMEWGGVGVI